MHWRDQHLLIVGLGMTGWSAVRYLHAQGARLTVCDSREEPPYADALARDYPAVPLHAGSLDPALIQGQDALIVSPGLDLKLPLFRAASEAGVPLLGDIEVFARDNRVPVLAVTGSNGKSTVVSLLGAMAKRSGKRVLVGGNIGTPALDLLGKPADLIVLELSSFQLELTEQLPSLAASVLNLSADHMDRHGSMPAYAAAKGRIFRGAACAVVNRDDAATQALPPTGMPLRSFSLNGSADCARKSGALWVDGERWMLLDDLKLLGAHNHANVLAAFALGLAADLPRAAMVEAAREFPGLAHRCEWVADKAGVRWINDSKGTNVGATLAALQGIDAPVVLLAGGQAKGGDFRPWVDALLDKGRGVFLFGEDADLMAGHLAPLHATMPVRNVHVLANAVSQAAGLAQSGDVVLLSPGCASFDQFSGYMQRGECFKALVGEVA